LGRGESVSHLPVNTKVLVQYVSTREHLTSILEYIAIRFSGEKTPSELNTAMLSLLGDIGTSEVADVRYQTQLVLSAVTITKKNLSTVTGILESNPGAAVKFQAL
jgi:hypothetical protein